MHSFCNSGGTVRCFAFEFGSELEFELRKLGTNSSGLRKYDYVCGVRTAVTVGNSQTSLQAVAQHGFAE